MSLQLLKNSVLYGKLPYFTVAINRLKTFGLVEVMLRKHCYT